MKATANHPQWALDQKRPGTELRCIRGKYYLYECSSFYDKERKTTRKKTGKYLGRVTEDQGLVLPRRRQVEIENLAAEEQAASGQPLAPEPRVGEVQEYGLSAFINSECAELAANLRASMPRMWTRVLALAYCRLRCQSPLMNVKDDFCDSHLSQTLGATGLSPRALTDFLKALGRDRAGMLAFMRKYTGLGGNILFDGTDMLSSSAKMDFPRMSKTKLGGFAEAVNLMMGFSTGAMLPVYYRLLPGNVRDLTAFLECVDEFGDRGVTIIADKGFYSRHNIEQLDQRGLGYVIAMRRSTAGLDYQAFEHNASDGHFFYADRLIKYSRQQIDGRTVYLYRDARHAAEEENDYVRRVDDPSREGYTPESYALKAPQFGTLALLTSPGKEGPQAYIDYKSRCEVEQEIDVLKTDLDALTSYMQDNHSLEGWMFINFVALHIFYMIRRKIASSPLAGQLSARDAIRIMCRQRIVRLDDAWHLSATSKKDRAQLAALGIPIT